MKKTKTGHKQTVTWAGGLKVEYRPLDSLVPYARNPPTHSEEQIAQIAASIREFGFTNPILIDSSQGIIAGHGRFAAAKDLKLEKVPCIDLSHLTKEQKRAFTKSCPRIGNLSRTLRIACGFRQSFHRRSRPGQHIVVFNKST